jgi:ubiquinone/menaquinone biosynthesis C-methylase UbiE
MNSLFGSEAMAAGYARSRPAVHEKIVGRVRERLGADWRAGRGLDVGCGAGLSLKALSGICEECHGVEPVEAMVRWAKAVAPGARVVAGEAEALPYAAGTMEVITAAGSLNFVRDLAQAFRELARVLAPGGTLVVYDFGHGRRFRDSAALEEWCAEFYRRWPAPAGTAIELSPAILAGMETGFTVTAGEAFEIGIAMGQGAYADYAMTETNISEALRRGESEAAIRAWCVETLGEVFGGRAREVLFEGYIAYLAAIRG